MAAYLIRRFLLMLLTLFGISVLVFVLLRIVPGNIADILFSAAGMINPEEKLEIERQLRSEEHTSELQLQFHLVCRLLLEKKKKKHRSRQTSHSPQQRHHHYEHGQPEILPARHR